MKFTVHVLIESPGAVPLSISIQTVDRPCERVEDVGLRLEEAKAVLQGLQKQLICQQLAEYGDNLYTASIVADVAMRVRDAGFVYSTSNTL